MVVSSQPPPPIDHYEEQKPKHVIKSFHYRSINIIPAYPSAAEAKSPHSVGLPAPLGCAAGDICGLVLAAPAGGGAILLIDTPPGGGGRIPEPAFLALAPRDDDSLPSFFWNRQVQRK